MNIEETLEKANILQDSKARRVLNTAPDQIADITLDEIEHGVTIERLETLTVPVYQYGGQITIHGIFKDIPSDLRVHGYKSIFLNGNKSLGVKYVAIDRDKKSILSHAMRFRKDGHAHWGIIIDSQGCTAQRIFRSDDKQSCIDCYNSTPDTLFIGNKEAVKIWYGGYAVILYIGAVYQDKLWQLVNALTGIGSQAEFDNAVKAEAEADAISHAEYEAERKAEAEVNKAKMATAMANFKAPDNWVTFNGNITEVGVYARLTDRYSDGIALQVIKIAKRGGRLCANSKLFYNFEFKDWQPDHYKQANYTIIGWRITDAVKADAKTAPVTAKAQSATQSKPQPDITISHNDKLNGIEISFKTKPSDTVINQLKDMGFRWSYKSVLWYNRYTTELWDKINTEFKVGVC